MTSELQELFNEAADAFDYLERTGRRKREAVAAAKAFLEALQKHLIREMLDRVVKEHLLPLFGVGAAATLSRDGISPPPRP